MMLPAAGFFLVSFLWPMVLVGRLSLFRSDYVTTVFAGLGNYRAALSDAYFLKSFVNGFIFVAIIAPPSVLLAYLAASFLSGFSERVQGIGRFVIYVPGLTSGLIMALLWGWLFLRDGLVNEFLGAVGIQAVPWLARPWTARVAIAVISVTSGLGGYVIIFSAAMRSVPRELHDAAMTDGASLRQYRHHVVLPLMVPTITLCLLLAVVGIMQMWETIYVLAQDGGPEGATASPVYEIFLTAFKFGKAGLAASKGIILLVVIAAMLLIKQRVEKWARV